MNVPFAFLTDYEAGWQGRYHALRSDGMAINLNVDAHSQTNWSTKRLTKTDDN